MKFRAVIIACIFGWTMFLCNPGFAQEIKDGTGLNSQILWSTPGPGDSPFIQSAQILAHRNVSFSIIADHYRKPLGIEIGDSVYWSVKRATVLDFSWAIGLMDRFQLGMVLPLHVEQAGKGAAPLESGNAASDDAEIGVTAVNDLRFHAKTILFQQHPHVELRGAGIALDMGLSIPTGDEDNFAGEKGIVWAPTLVMDFRREWLSAGAVVGVRMRSGEKAGLADSEVGNQLSYGLGITFHLFDEKLLLGGETTVLAEMDNFDHVGMELRGVIGSKPADSKAMTIWLTASSGLANQQEPLLCVPQLRFTLGVTYTPVRDDTDDEE
jgi:hypothetical protein